jgi:Fe-S oxidoreductase
MDWQSILFLVVASGFFGVAGYRLFILFSLMKAHQGKDHRIKPDLIGERLKTFIVNVFGQKAVLEKKGAGIMHATIFWGFLIITLETLEQFASTLYRPFSFQFIGTIPYSSLKFLQDFFVFAILVALGFAAYRRFIVRPNYLGQSRDANLILLFTAALMVSIFLTNGFHILGNQPTYQNAMPFSLGIASLLSTFNLSTQSHSALSDAFKWVHMLIVLGFAAYIPGSKHLHILAAGPNTFFKHLKREKRMKSIDFEDETVEQFGTAKITDLSWKDSLDYYSCTECGRCEELCPAWNTQKPLSPKKLITDLKNNLYAHKDQVLTGKYEDIGHVVDGNISEDVIWACTSCRACETACPVFIEHTDKIYDIRRNLVMMESRFPKEVQTVFKNMETHATPWAFSREDRSNWANDLEIQTMADVQGQDLDVLLWVGCAGSYDDRNKKVMRAFVNILKKAEIRFAILGNEEQCTGDPARRIGNEYLFQSLAQANVETLNNYQVKKIVTACPHCFNTLKNEYPDFGGKYEVIHHSEMIAELIQSGKIKPAKPLEEKVTFHDSCYLGRWNNIYAEPRDILKSIPSTEIIEMKSNHDKSMCCGAGGGRMWMEETIGERINMKRTDQAIETKAGIIASSCPFCMTMLGDGVKEKEVGDKMTVKDIAELVNDSLTV